MRTLRLPALSTAALLLGALPLAAQTTTPTVSLGAGLQTSYQFTKPDGADGTDQFLLNSARLYVSGTASKNIKFMFNTEYNGATNTIGVLDAAAQFEFSPKFNIWVGRFLPPSDRANLYGPYYAHHWARLHRRHPGRLSVRLPAAATTASMYWGQFGKVKVSGGAFDGQSRDRRRPTVLVAGRVQVDFWDPKTATT